MATCASNKAGRLEECEACLAIAGWSAQGQPCTPPLYSTSRVCRSSAVSRSIWLIGWSGWAATAASKRRQRSASAATVAASNKSLAYSTAPWMPTAPPSAPRCSARANSRSNLAVLVATGTVETSRPGSAKALSALFCHTNMTWNSGWWDSERAGFNASTRYSNGRSWCA